MQQIADWLEKLGMSEYAQRFAENRIDFSVLPELTDQDLEKLGVVLGDRRKMLRAIASLEGFAKTETPVARTSTDVPAKDAAERRQVTVMFSDLVGSTALSARTDPRIYARSFQLIRNASRRLLLASVGSSRSTWATECSCISATPWRMRMTPNVRCGRAWS
jgi:hypothetical protein